MTTCRSDRPSRSAPDDDVPASRPPPSDVGNPGRPGITLTARDSPRPHRGIPIYQTAGANICLEMGSPARSSLAVLNRTVRDLLVEIRSKKQTPLLIIDEAHLLRFEVFAQLHSLTQFQFDSQNLMPVVLAGQNSLLDKLLFHTSRPLASRVVGRSYLEALKLEDMPFREEHRVVPEGGPDEAEEARDRSGLDAGVRSRSGEGHV